MRIEPLTSRNKVADPNFGTYLAQPPLPRLDTAEGNPAVASHVYSSRTA
jgi:hypothetical protein